MSITALIRPPWRRALTRIMPFTNPILSPRTTPYAEPHQPWKLLHTGRRRTPLGTRWASMTGLPTRCCMYQHDGVLRRADDNSSKPLPLMLFPQLFQDREAVVRYSEAATRPANGHTRPLDFLHRLGPHKLVVAVDVDEVLGSFLSALNKFIADRYSLNHSLSEYYVYEFFKIWNCSRAEDLGRMSSKITHLTGLSNIILAYFGRSTLAIILLWMGNQGRNLKFAVTPWKNNSFIGVRSKITLSLCLDNIRGNCRPALTIAKETAPAILLSLPSEQDQRSLGAQVLVDDNPRYAIECADVGIRVLLFDYDNSYPWCKTEAATSHPLVTKVHNWQEVEQHLVSWSVV